MSVHTSVIMDLGGIMQHVWVPMTEEQAVKSGLRLSTVPSPCAVEPVPAPPLPMEKTSVAPVEGNAVPPEQPLQATESAPASMETRVDDEETQALRALKNSYMRFYRQ